MAKYYKQAAVKAQRGFTLVELITVVTLLGILALSVIPRFMGSSGFAEYTLQKRLLASLRNSQLKAMHDTRGEFCYRTNFVTGSDTSAAFGPSTKSYLSGQELASCETNIDDTSPEFLRTSSGEINAQGVSFSAQDDTTAITYVQFGSFGRASTSAGSCANGCTLTFTGQSLAKICIADEGYVYACE
jgi:MSHA pilin protein MshC